MKNATYIALVLALSGCVKSASPPVPNQPLLVSSHVIDKGQPVYITTPASTPAHLTWLVGPDNITTNFYAFGHQAVAYFGTPGTYTVGAGWLAPGTENDSVGDGCTIVVTDTPYRQPTPVTFDTLWSNIDTIRLDPFLDSSGALFFIARTAGSYGGFPTLLYTISYGPGWNAGITLSFYGIVSEPTAGFSSPAFAYFYIALPQPSDGNYPLTVYRPGGAVYTGNFNVFQSAHVFTFNWGYSSGVIFTETNIGR